MQQFHTRITIQHHLQVLSSLLVQLSPILFSRNWKALAVWSLLWSPWFQEAHWSSRASTWDCLLNSGGYPKFFILGLFIGEIKILVLPTRLIHYMQFVSWELRCGSQWYPRDSNLLNQSSKKASEFLLLGPDLLPVGFLGYLQFSYLELDNLSSAEISLAYAWIWKVLCRICGGFVLCLNLSMSL